MRREDYPWLHALTTPPLATGNARRLEQEGVSPRAADRAVAVIERALADDGPLTRAALRERVAAAGVRTEGQALVHILMLATPARPDRARPRRRRRPGVRAGPRLARRAAARRPRRGARRARAALPRGARPGGRPRPREVGRASGCATRAPGSARSPPSSSSARTGSSTSPRRAPAAGAPGAAAARPVRPAPARLAIARAGARRAPGRRDRQRDLPADRARPRPRRRDLADARGGGRPRAVRAHRARRPGGARRPTPQDVVRFLGGRARLARCAD